VAYSTYTGTARLISLPDYRNDMAHSNDSPISTTVKRCRDWLSEHVHVGERLRVPSLRSRSRSLSPDPRSSPDFAASSRMPATLGPIRTASPLLASPPPPASTLAPSQSPTVLTSTPLPTPASVPVLALGPALAPTLRPVSAPPPATIQSLASQTFPKAAVTQQSLLPLGQSEIRERTFILLEQRLSHKELRALEWEKYMGTTAEHAKGVVEGVRNSMDGSATKMDKILGYVNKYCTIIDVAIQHQPQITALVWAGVRTCIQVCIRSFE
jgi:hypothetical protein